MGEFSESHFQEGSGEKKGQPPTHETKEAIGLQESGLRSQQIFGRRSTSTTDSSVALESNLPMRSSGMPRFSFTLMPLTLEELL